MVDASTKPDDAWRNLLNFISSVAANFNINQNCVRMAVIIYADSPQASIALNIYGDINSLRGAIGSLRLIGGSTNLVSALQLLRNQVFASNVRRPGARLVAGIFTDELRSCDALLTSEANQLRNMGVVMFGVAITQFVVVDTNCLRQVVNPGQVIEVTNYNQLNNYVSQASQYACVSAPAPTPAPPGPAPCKYVAISGNDDFSATYQLVVYLYNTG